jgi:hypothetical protein
VSCVCLGWSVSVGSVSLHLHQPASKQFNSMCTTHSHAIENKDMTRDMQCGCHPQRHSKSNRSILLVPCSSTSTQASSHIDSLRRLRLRREAQCTAGPWARLVRSVPLRMRAEDIPEREGKINKHSFIIIVRAPNDPRRLQHTFFCAHVRRKVSTGDNNGLILPRKVFLLSLYWASSSPYRFCSSHSCMGCTAALQNVRMSPVMDRWGKAPDKYMRSASFHVRIVLRVAT